MPVIQDILECFGICSACSISVMISIVGFVCLMFFVVVFNFFFFFFKAELSSYSRCEVLNFHRTILVEGDLSMLFVCQDWVGVELGLDCSGFCFPVCQTHRNRDSAPSLGPWS